MDIEEELAAGPKLGEGIMLSELFRRYEIEISPTKAGYKWESDRFAVMSKLPIGQMPLSEIQREHIEDWINWRMESVKGSTVNRELNLIGACFTQARRWRLMSHFPLADLKRPKNPQHRDRLISAFEVQQLKDAAGYSETCPTCARTVKFPMDAEQIQTTGTCSTCRPILTVEQKYQIDRLHEHNTTNNAAYFCI